MILKPLINNLNPLKEGMRVERQISSVLVLTESLDLQGLIYCGQFNTESDQPSLIEV